MTQPIERAREIVDKYWKKSGFKDPNPYLLETDISQALTLYGQECRNQGLEEAAKVAEDKFNGFEKHDDPETAPGYWLYFEDIAECLRSLKSPNTQGGGNESPKT